MLRTMKKAMVAGAVIAVGALAGPAMASAAPQWNTGATSSPGQSVAGTGQLTFTTMYNKTITCDVEFEADLWNAADSGSVRGLGKITSFQWGSGTYLGCSTSLGCSVTVATNTTTPWGIRVADDGTVGITGINLTYVFSSSSCPVDGLIIPAFGSVGGGVLHEEGQLVFEETLGLMSPFGDALLSGSLGLSWEDDQSPVELS